MESMERGGGGGGGGGGSGLRFLLRLDTGEPALDRGTLLGFSLSALLARLLGWSRRDGRPGRASSVAIAGASGGEESGRDAVSAAALAAAVSLTLAAMYASDQRLRPPRPPRARRPPPPPAPDSAARPRALPAPQEGLRILSSNDEPSDSVIHGASIGGAGDDEPDIVARVEMVDTTPAAIADGPEAEGEERLRELWLSLVEREQRLELRLQELEGLRAQEAAVRELESRAAAAAREERVLQLRLSTLQEENGRLRAQADDLGSARADLARAKEKLRALKARLQAEQEEARREAAVAELERDHALAAEIADLRNANAKLEEDNLELALRLQDAQQAAEPTSANLVLQEDLVEEAKYLRESNERLTRQIEQLRRDHCAHVEELVYLKWVNACLRHELRDHDGGHPTTAGQQDHHDGDVAAGARDLTALELSKSMSFRSSERAKQLMLRYGHPGLDGFDNPATAVFSPLHESSSVDGDERSPARNYEPERRSPSASAAAAAALAGKKTGPRKLKFLGNIKKLLPGGKRSHSNQGHAGRGGGKAPAPSDEYLEKAMRWLSTHDVLDSDHSYESTPLSSCARTPVSSVTTNTTADSRGAPRGGGGHSERVPRAEPVLARSKSDAGGSYGREASQYHALRPDHPAAAGLEPQGFRATEKPEARRRSAGAQLSDDAR